MLGSVKVGDVSGSSPQINPGGNSVSREETSRILQDLAVEDSTRRY